MSSPLVVKVFGAGAAGCRTRQLRGHWSTPRAGDLLGGEYHRARSLLTAIVPGRIVQLTTSDFGEKRTSDPTTLPHGILASELPFRPLFVFCASGFLQKKGS